MCDRIRAAYDAEDLRQIADAEGEGMWYKGGEATATWEAAHAEAFNEGRAYSFTHSRVTLEAHGFVGARNV